jgi:type II secretory pathway pseudopilin PulG
VKRQLQAGFTIIELMIALLISTLLVIMILSIFSRMSFAYRQQQQVVGAQQLLGAAKTAIELDAKQTGLELSQGFKIATQPGNLQSPLQIVDSAVGPDEVGFYYADPSAQAVVRTVTGALTGVTLDAGLGASFAVLPAPATNLVVLVNVDTISMSNPISPTTDAKIAKFDACVLQITQVVGDAITFSSVAPWGNGGNTHCTAPVPNRTMMYKFVARYWRLDPTPARLADGVLQVSNIGNLPNINPNWEDQAFNLTDLQVATLFYDGDGVDTADPGTDGDRDWSSDNVQFGRTTPIGIAAAFVPPLMVSISLVARTDRDVEGVGTGFTPTLAVTTNMANNNIGNHDKVSLPSATDDRLKGNRIYRYVTFQVDMRNMGVGR